MTIPILYSFRRCPFAMRARLMLLVAGVTVELREVVLRAKPAAMLTASPKATVPVLVLPDHIVIDESLDIMRWASLEGGGIGWMTPDDEALVAANDGTFKYHLDRYKYADRYPADPTDHRAEATCFLERLDARLCQHPAVGGHRLSLVDLAILPFIRQFAQTDIQYFDALPFARLQRRLDDFLNSPLFAQAMIRFAPWQPDLPPVIFPHRRPDDVEWTADLAEEVGFEPTDELPHRWFSRPVP